MVTASIAHSCFTRATTFLRSDASANIQPFLNLVLRTSSIFTPAMKAGVENEGKAKKAYMDFLASQGHLASLKEVGFSLSKDVPILGCSPDGVVTFACPCCEGEVILLEVKSPAKLENSFSNFEKRALKREYKTQVNVQMGIMGITKAHVFIWTEIKEAKGETSKGKKSEAVRQEYLLCELAFEQSQFEELCGQIIKIYKKAVLHELLERV